MNEIIHIKNVNNFSLFAFNKMMMIDFKSIHLLKFVRIQKYLAKRKK